VKVLSSPEGFSSLLGGSPPVVICLTSDFSLVISRKAPKGAQANVSVASEAGGEGNGLIFGPVFAVQRDAHSSLVDMDEGSAAALRGFLGGRRVGAC
jgi:hypothetical protein